MALKTKQTFMQSADALGTTIELHLVTDDNVLAERWFKKLWDYIADFEQCFSRFIADSELSHVNNNAGQKVLISKDFRLWLESLANLSDKSDDLFNPFVLPNLQRAGYTTSATDNINKPLDYKDRQIATIGHLEVGDNWVRIPSNTALDSGGSGKGYLADKLASLLSPTLKNYCISIGGDMVVSGRNPEGNWQIDIPSAVSNKSDIARYQNNDDGKFAVATSGLVRQKKNNQPINHIIDPQTGKSVVSDIDVCTVVADNATLADGLASSILIGGRLFAEKILNNKTVSSCILQYNNKEIVIIGDGFTLLDNASKANANQSTLELSHA